MRKAFLLIAVCLPFALTNPTPARAQTDAVRAAHVLHRLAFGPRPGEIQRVADMGVNRWIEEQLRPAPSMDASAISALSGCPPWYQPAEPTVSVPSMMVSQVVIRVSTLRARAGLPDRSVPVDAAAEVLAAGVARGDLKSIPIEQWPEWKDLLVLPFDGQVDGVVRSLLAGLVSDATRSSMLAIRPTATASAEERATALRDLVAVALISPEFQRR
jgi:hypothetical protein